MKGIVFAAALLVIAVIVFAVWIRPQLTATNVLRGERLTLETTLTRFRELREARDRLLSRYNTILRQDLERLETLLPKTPATGGIITQLDRLASSHALLLKSVDVKETQQQATSPITRSRGRARQLTINTNLVGSYQSFRAFLQDLERSLRLMDVESLSFSSGGENVYQFTLRASAYWFPE